MAYCKRTSKMHSPSQENELTGCKTIELTQHNLALNYLKRTLFTNKKSLPVDFGKDFLFIL
jgi:hypothetical protein